MFRSVDQIPLVNISMWSVLCCPMVQVLHSRTVGMWIDSRQRAYGVSITTDNNVKSG